MANAIDNCTAADINMGVQLQSSLYQLRVAERTIAEDPFANVFDGGTRKAFVGETLTINIPGRVVLNQSMTAPETTRKIDSCGYQGPTAEYGSTNYDSRMERILGRGPDLCIHRAFHTIEGALAQHEKGLVDMIKEHMSADNRYQALVLSGHKYVVNSTGAFYDLVTGGDRQIQVDFAGGVPDGHLTFKRLVRIVRHIRETSDVKLFGNGAGAHAVFIAGSGLIDMQRDEAGLKTETLAFVQGGDVEAKAALRRFSFAKYPYREISTAEDPRPLRFNEVDGDGFPVLIEPYEAIDTDNGREWRISREWLTAAHEVGFIFFANTLKRTVPESLTKIGSATFPAQSVMGALQWANFASQGCNERQEVGHFNYDITRAFEPVCPWGICPVLYKRCDPDDGEEPCTSVYPEGDANLPQ